MPRTRRESDVTPQDHRQLPVFVYGTLRPGQCNHDLFLRGRTTAVRPARLHGAVLYEGPGYPYAVADPAGDVLGEIITLAPADYRHVLAALDVLENHMPGDPASLYDRVEREVRLTGSGEAVRAWVYLAADRVARRLRASGTTVPGGSWPGPRLT
ncbi:gamma-glutamylcyclotransferase [Streptomyces morookaense]|nr:gamma-glutamylcyclotransferase [Streptomyces morookaense]